MKFVSVCYLVPGICLQKLENDRDVLSMCQIGLANPEKEVHVYLENVESKGGPVSDIGPLIEVHAMPINCSVKSVTKIFYHHFLPLPLKKLSTWYKGINLSQNSLPM